MLDPSPDQLPLPLPLDEAALTAFVTAYLSIEDEQERLREALATLKKQYQALLPLRGLLAALKVERTLRKVEGHATEGMPRAHVEALRGWVQTYLEQRAREVEMLIDDVTGEIL